MAKSMLASVNWRKRLQVGNSMERRTSIKPRYKSLMALTGLLLLAGSIWYCQTLESEAVVLATRSNVQQRAELKLPLMEPSIVVYKKRRELELYSRGSLLRTYRIGLGFNPVPDKQREGDGATPEGEFYVFTKNPRSSYYLSLGLSYPNAEDAERGFRDGLISRAQHDQIVRAIQDKVAPPQYTPLGGLIYIHGNGSERDWTLGCVALDNADMKELFDAAAVGTPVTIKP